MDQNVFVLNSKWETEDLKYFKKNYTNIKTIYTITAFLIIYWLITSILDIFQKKSLDFLVSYSMLAFSGVAMVIVIIAIFKKKITSTYLIRFKNSEISINNNDFYPSQNLIICQKYLFLKNNGKSKVGIIPTDLKNELELYFKYQNIQYRVFHNPFPFKQYVKNKI